MATTFRTDVVAGLKDVLDDFTGAANAFTLVATYTTRPASFARPTPFAFIGIRPETVVHDVGTRTRTMQPTVTIVVQLVDNPTTMARLDRLIDLLHDAFTGRPHLAGNATIWKGGLTVSDEFVAEGDSIFQAVTFTFLDVSTQEGRT